MALDTEMMNSRGQVAPRPAPSQPSPGMSPMMAMVGADDEQAARIIAILKQLMQQPGGGGLGGQTPMGQQAPLMDPSPAPPGYRLNELDPRLMQVLQARQAGG